MVPISSLNIDIFCKVVDHFGDIGVSWRLCEEFQALGANIRYYCDRLDEFDQLIPSHKRHLARVQILPYDHIELHGVDLIIECFACQIPSSYLNHLSQTPRLWVVLEYLALESWATDFHLQQSPCSIPNCQKKYYFPGLGDQLGGILLDQKFAQQIQQITVNNRILWSQLYHLPAINSYWISLFSYNRKWHDLIDSLIQMNQPVVLWLAKSYAQEWFSTWLQDNSCTQINSNTYQWKNIQIVFLPLLSQTEYQELLLICDLNMVRGEDSFSRALLSGKPFLWHAYAQEESAHILKVEGFLATIQPYFKNDFVYLQDFLLRYNQRDSNQDDQSPELDFYTFIKTMTEHPAFKSIATEAQQRWNFFQKFPQWISQLL